MRALAIDIGSSAVKAGYWDGRRFAARTRIEFCTEFQGLRVEAPAARILQAVEHAGREVLRHADPIDIISFCAFSSGVVVTDHRGQVRLGAITHQDRRSVAEAQNLVHRLGKSWLLEHTGNLPYPGGIGSSTIAWIRRHAAAALTGKYRLGQLSSLVAWMLTGRWTIDPSQAAFLGLWDIRSRNWNQRLCHALGIARESLPELVYADTVIGTLTPRMANLWGRPAILRQGTPVVGGFVDTDAAVIQTPMRPGQLIHNTGSTDVLAMCMAAPRPKEGMLSRPLGTKDGAWLAVRTIAAAGSAITWARHTLFRELDERSWLRSLRRATAVTHEPWTLHCAAQFAGSRTSIGQDRGALFAGVRLSTTREELLAAIMKSLAAQSRLNYAALQMIQRPAETVFCMGDAKDLARLMHAHWPQAHRFKKLPGDSLTGLVTLARSAAAG